MLQEKMARAKVMCSAGAEESAAALIWAIRELMQGKGNIENNLLAWICEESRARQHRWHSINNRGDKPSE
jgi:hypothetical protein